MDRLETRELAYFVAVAEELHFSRAAARLGIAQPPLSRAIGRLERRIGVALFERSSRSVALTPAGGVFLRESRVLLEALDAAVEHTRAALGDQPLRVATRPGAGTRLLADTAAAFERATGVGITLHFTHDQAEALRRGRADVAVLCDSLDLTELDRVAVATEDPVVLLPRGHRLATRAAVGLADLASAPGFRPDCPALGLDELVQLVALGQLVAVVGHSAADRVGESVVAVAVRDLPPTQLVVAWRQGAASPAVAEFVRCAQASAGPAVVAGRIGA